MVSGVYILLSPQEEEVHSSSWGHRCTDTAVHSTKIFKPLSVIILPCQGYCLIEKKKKKEKKQQQKTHKQLCYSAYNQNR